MTLLEQTYKGLRQAGLVGTAEAFSTQYLGKNKNWYALQAHYGRDFSVSAAVQCLRSLRSSQISQNLNKIRKRALDEAELALTEHLNTRYFIANVVE